MNSNARFPRSPRTRSRALLALAALAVAAAGVLAGSALRSGPEPTAAVLDVERAVASSVPATVPPFASAPSTAPAPISTPDRGATTTASTTSTTTTTTVPGLPSSALAALVGERQSAIPPEIEPRLRPVGLRIGRIFVDDPVVEVGLEDDGELEVPGATEIGWYRYGASPGRAGATVLAAHVTWNGEYGPFLNLGELDPGDRVEVDLEDGSQRVYEVVERTMYDKDGLPRERIWRNTGHETLVLITCGGDFDPDINRYRENIVVYAVPVA